MIKKNECFENGTENHEKSFKGNCDFDQLSEREL